MTNRISSLRTGIALVCALAPLVGFTGCTGRNNGWGDTYADDDSGSASGTAGSSRNVAGSSGQLSRAGESGATEMGADAGSAGNTEMNESAGQGGTAGKGAAGGAGGSAGMSGNVGTGASSGSGGTNAAAGGSAAGFGGGAGIAELAGTGGTAGTAGASGTAGTSGTAGASGSAGTGGGTTCGNGTVEGTEACDDHGPSPVCSNTCTRVSTAACVACENTGTCAASMDNCLGPPGVAFTSAQQTQCYAVMSCIESSNCFDSAGTLTKCYCGTLNASACNAAPFTGAGSPDGACVNQIQAGMTGLTTNASVLGALTASAKPAGAAMARLTCQKTDSADANGGACQSVCGLIAGGPAFP